MIGILAAVAALAGDPAPAADPTPPTGVLRPVTVSAGWFGEQLVHPGVFGGVETPLVAGRHHAVVVAARLAAYTHPRHHTGIALRAEVGYRATARFGLYAEALAGLGAHHRFLAAPVYVEREGQLRRTVDLGRLTAMPGATVGLGWDLAARGDRPVRVFARVDGWARSPVNGAAVPGGAVSVGAAITLGREGDR